MIGRLILWLSIIWLVPLMYFMLRSETKFKKNLAVGVTLPYEGRDHPETVKRLNRFKKQLGLICVLLLALAVMGIFLPVSFGLSLTIFCVWTDLCIVLPYIPYITCNRSLKQLKEARGWRYGTGRGVSVDLTAAAQPLEELSLLHFLIPMLISLIPAAWEMIEGNWAVGLILLIDTLCVVLLYGAYRWCYRRKSETVDENTDLTNALTRLRRKCWIRCWSCCSWFMGVLNPAIWLMFYFPVAGFLAVGVLTMGLVAAVVGIEFRLRRAQERLTVESGRAFYVDTDDKWIWGIFYYDSNDRHIVVNARTGNNTTVNLARRGGRVIMGLVAALLIFMPLMGVLVMAEEQSPVTLELTETSLTAGHRNTRYEIPLEEIDRVELVEERPSGLTRVVGTAMDMVSKGKYRSGDYGDITLCLDPRSGPWLMVVDAEGERWLFGAGKVTEEVYHRLISETAPGSPQ